MDVVSACPLPAGWILWQNGAGAFTLTVVCKATYVLLPGASPLDDEQEQPAERDEHWDDDERRSLHAASDFAPYKRGADVLLVGHAFAPEGRPVRSLLVRLVVGTLDKSLEVHRDRGFTLDGQLREGARFSKMPLRWERAAGGPGTSNPAGVSADGPPDSRGVIALPNLQPAGLHVTSRGDFIPPAGYGPIGPSWPERSARIRRHLATWDPRRWGSAPLPVDLDPAFFNAAPADQQLDTIRANERIVLENLHPEHPRLATSLVTAVPRVVVEQARGAPQEIGLRCDTLCIDTDRGRCSLTWRGLIPLEDPRQAGRVTVTLAGGAGADRAVIPPSGAWRQTLDTPLAASMPALPFRMGRSPLSGSVLGHGNEASPPAEEAPWEQTATEEPVDLRREPRFTLPFVRAPGGPAASTPTAPPALHRPAADDDETEIEVPTRPAFHVPHPVIDPPAAEPPRWIPVHHAVAEVAPVSPPAIVAAIPTPPPAPPEPPAPAPPPAAEEAPGLPLARYPLERCARIAASIARRRPETPRILAAHELSQPIWEALERHWAGAIHAESARGKSTLLRVHDAAYVAQLEEERGPIRIDEYARLVVAGERGGAEALLAELGLPRGALLRIQRVWLGKMVSDAELGKSVRSAVASAREE